MATRRPTDDASSEEEEATAIDLRDSNPAFRNAISKPAGQPPKAIGGVKPAKKPAPGALHVSEDEEATEFLAMRPSSSASGDPQSNPSSSSLRARGRAVPLGGGGDDVSAGGAGRARDPMEPVKTEPNQEMPAQPLPPLPLKVNRPLPHERQTNVKSETQTDSTSNKSAPRITRIVVPDDDSVSMTTHKVDAATTSTSATDPGAAGAGGVDDSDTAPPLPVNDGPPKARPLPDSADAPKRPAPRPPTVVAASPEPDKKRDDPKDRSGKLKPPSPDRPKTQKVQAPSSETLEAEPADGTLIVEVPDGAVVFVNGMERGSGPTLKVKDIDRYAKHQVRIHAPGYAPWSGSVCLEGRTAAKIRPQLRPKGK